jgi:hypothetical protein
VERNIGLLHRLPHNGYIGTNHNCIEIPLTNGIFNKFLFTKRNRGGEFGKMIMPKSYDDWGYGGSRDYCLPSIPCAVSLCPCNKNGKCELPSLIVIRADGRCQTGVDFMSDEKQKQLKIVKPKTRKKKS